MSYQPPLSPLLERCVACQASLPREREWCLECGAARTEIRGAPDWRLPVIAVAVVVALVVLVLVLVLP